MKWLLHKTFYACFKRKINFPAFLAPDSTVSLQTYKNCHKRCSDQAGKVGNKCCITNPASLAERVLNKTKKQTNFATSVFLSQGCEKVIHYFFSFVTGNENHFLSLTPRSFSGKKTQILMWFLICILPQKVTQLLVKKGLVLRYRFQVSQRKH